MRRISVFTCLCFVFLNFWAITANASLFESGKASLAFTGDIMMHINVKRCAHIMNRPASGGGSENNGGFDYLYKEIAPLFSGIDFVVGNMEFPVAPPFRQKEIIFNAPPEAILGIRDAGFDCVSLANNHILDQYVKGAQETMRFLDRYNLPYIGVGRSEEEARRGHIVDINGIRVGLIAYTGLINYPNRNTGKDFYLNWLYNRKQLLADIRRMKKSCDYLVMQPHTGVEYVIEPRQRDRTLFHACLNEGVDLIIGHHPHMLQTMEQFRTDDGRDTAIFYSLGNFISDQKRYVPIRNTGKKLHIRDSVVVRVDLRKIFGSVSDSVSVIPIHTVHTYTTKGGRRYKDIQTVVIRKKIAELQQMRAAYTEDDPQYSKITSRIQYYNQRVEAISLTLFHQNTPPGIIFNPAVPDMR